MEEYQKSLKEARRNGIEGVKTHHVCRIGFALRVRLYCEKHHSFVVGRKDTLEEVIALPIREESKKVLSQYMLKDIIGIVAVYV
jgi:hypothetical protein